jgi:hypothetical protein
MAKKFKIKALHLANLAAVTMIEPKELMEMIPEIDMAGLRRFDKLKDELLEANVGYSDSVAAVNKAIKPIADEFKEKSAELDEPQKAALLAELNARSESLSEAVNMKEAAEQEVEAVIASNERFEMLKTIFRHKNTLAKWRDTKVMVAVDDALNAAVEAEV